MKKVCQNWQQVFSAETLRSDLFDEFAIQARKAAAEVFRVKTTVEARVVLKQIVKDINAQKVVAVDCPLQQTVGVNEVLQAMGVEVYTEIGEIAVHAKTADLGISGVEFGIAESGSVFQDAFAVESRLVSTLVPVHVVFLYSAHIIPGIEDAMNILSEVYARGYVSFITGPSRTADIERILTIGVHGPGRFIIIAVDERR